MTEEEWLTCEDPMRVLKFLKAGNNNDRKLRLFACGCYRQSRDCLADECTRSALEVAERFADELTGPRELRAARTDQGGPHNARFWVTRTSVFAAAGGALWSPLDRDTRTYDQGSRYYRFPKALALLREIFGNPFRLAPFSPSWRTSTAVALAAQMYESRDFGAMPILADALQDAGCDSADILDHCREPSRLAGHSLAEPGERDERPHVRGCWVVDLVLGKA